MDTALTITDTPVQLRESTQIIRAIDLSNFPFAKDPPKSSWPSPVAKAYMQELVAFTAFIVGIDETEHKIAKPLSDLTREIGFTVTYPDQAPTTEQIKCAEHIFTAAVNLPNLIDPDGEELRETHRQQMIWRGLLFIYPHSDELAANGSSKIYDFADKASKYYMRLLHSTAPYDDSVTTRCECLEVVLNSIFDVNNTRLQVNEMIATLVDQPLNPASDTELQEALLPSDLRIPLDAPSSIQVLKELVDTNIAKTRFEIPKDIDALEINSVSRDVLLNNCTSPDFAWRQEVARSLLKAVIEIPKGSIQVEAIRGNLFHRALFMLDVGEATSINRDNASAMFRNLNADVNQGTGEREVRLGLSKFVLSHYGYEALVQRLVSDAL